MLAVPKLLTMTSVALDGVIRVLDDIVADVHTPLGQDSLQARVLADRARN